ncbi:hypothetical protein M758_1G299600 [Ceratodon purpureus]|nr:hypothetical protein KC19_1G306200 [Ceratodon purpureus]KAG0593123.1 hypothetical protein KC19_1G306200 [Ceratodon purpureus]KAG0632033.1 hypothetical protein M758_1G299600 [Ceratodon purpureus]
MSGPWDAWLDDALQSLGDAMLLRSLRPLVLPETHVVSQDRHALPTFEGLGPWDRAGVAVEVSHATVDAWLRDSSSTGEEVERNPNHNAGGGDNAEGELHKLLLFSGNDYLGLSVHPAVRQAAAQAAVEFGMGPRASALVCGYTSHHRLLESTLAELKETEECLLCPTGFAANMAVLTAITSVVPGKRGSGGSPVAIFSDALNHASIVDGVRVAQRQSNAEVHVYRHNDMMHLHQLLTNCKRERKVVVTDSLFSMDGDFAPLKELAALRKRHGFLLVIDEAHGTLVCGENGGGVAEAFGVQGHVDIHVGTLSKAIGCHGGFIASSRKWKQWIQSRGRSFIFSTALPVPVVAAAHAAIMVAKKEKWRQHNVWALVRQFSEATGLIFTSPIAPILFGDADAALEASR